MLRTHPDDEEPSAPGWLRRLMLMPIGFRSQFKLRTLLAAVTGAALLLGLSQHLAVSFSYDPDRSREFHLYVAWARKGDLNQERFVFLEVAHHRLRRTSSGWSWLILRRADAATPPAAATLARQ